MPSKHIKPLLFESYIAFIKNSVGARTFQNLYAVINGKKKDVMQHGDLSCAFFVSSVLTLFQLAHSRHATIKTTLKDMEQNGWVRIRKPKEGCVLVWDELMASDGKSHNHIGFYIGNKKAISNHPQKRLPLAHHWTFGITKHRPKRKVLSMWWHPRLSKNF